jgi:subtilase family serine protease
VARYQMQSLTLTAVQPEGAVGQWQNVWTHTYTATLNPCDGSFSGTGSMTGTQNGPVAGTETITGQLVGNAVSYTASRSFDNVVYSLSNAPIDNSTVTLATSTPVFPFDLEFKVNATTKATTNFKNHGEYVSSQGGGSHAAHSCIGMPIH